jgi:hypothetical protein
MRILIGMLALGLVVAPASADVLINDTLGVAPGPWVKSGAGPNAAVENDHGTGGDWNVGGSDGSGASPGYDVTYSQTFNMTPGLYQIDMSGWAKAWSGWWSGENWNWQQESHVSLLVDGVEIAHDWSGQNAFGQSHNWDTWTNATYSGQQQVNTSIELRLRAVKGNDNWGAGGLGAIWYASRFDDVNLSATLIPEPATLGLFALGAVLPLLRRRRA